MKGIVAIPLIWVAILLVWFFTTAPRATGQEQLPEQSAFLTTCNTAKQLGQIAGLNVSRCRKIAVEEDGNLALVTVKVWVDGQGIFIVRSALQKSVWTQSALDVTNG